MNTADLPCVKMTEQNNKYSESSILATELQILDEVTGKCNKDWYDRVYLCYEDTNFKPPITYGTY